MDSGSLVAFDNFLSAGVDGQYLGSTLRNNETMFYTITVLAGWCICKK
jgi:hypothetical protein